MASPNLNFPLGRIWNTLLAKDRPKERKDPRSITLAFDFSVQATYPIDLLLAQDTGLIDGIQTVYIDNGLNGSAVTLTVTQTQQAITAPPNSQGYYPIFMPDPPLATITSAGNVIVKCIFLNVKLEHGIWNVLNINRGPGVVLTAGTGISLAPNPITSVGTINLLGTVATQPYYDASTKIANMAAVQAAINFTMAYVPLSGLTGGTYSFASVGTAAVASWTGSGGAVTGISGITVAGSNYKVGDILQIAAGNQDALVAVASLSGSGIASLTILYGGTGYGAAGFSFLNPQVSVPFSFALFGVLTSPMTILMANGTYLTQGNQWIFYNNTTGAFTTTIKMSTPANVATGTGVVIPQGSNNSLAALLDTDGETDVWWGSNTTGVFQPTSIVAAAGTTLPFYSDTITFTNALTTNLNCMLEFATFVQTVNTANAAHGIHLKPQVGAANTANWTGNGSVIGLLCDSAILSGATGTINSLIGARFAPANNAAGATLTYGAGIVASNIANSGTLGYAAGLNIATQTASATATFDILIGPDMSSSPSISETGAWSIVQDNANPNKFTGQLNLGANNWSANNAQTVNFAAAATAGPGGAGITIQEWLTFKDAGGNVRYIPAFG